MKATKHELLSSRGRVLVLTSFVVWLLSAFATTAQADALAPPTNVVAREHQKTGNDYYHDGKYEKAIEEYKAGILREDAPVFSWNLGQCYRKLGRHEDALRHYERFLDRGKPTGEVEAAAKKFIAQTKAELDKKKRAAEPAAIKQPPVEPAPSPTGARSAQPVPANVPSAGRGRGMPWQRKLAIGIGTAGAVTLGLGVVLGLRAESFEADADAICPMSTCDRAVEATRLIDRGKTNALYANVALGVGGAAIIGATVLWITGARREGTMIGAQVSQSFTGVTASMRF